MKKIDGSKVVKEIPTRILLFMMDSPLWPRGQTAYWTRVPNVEQKEFECGARMLLHSFIVAFSHNPFQALIPLNFVGQQTKMKITHPLYAWRNENLPRLSRIWVHNIIKKNEFMIPPWLIPVTDMTTTLEEGIFSDKDWKKHYCLEQYCSLEEVIRLSRRLQDEIREQELEKKIAEEKALQDAKKKSLQPAKKKGYSKQKNAD